MGSSVYERIGEKAGTGGYDWKLGLEASTILGNLSKMFVHFFVEH